MLVHHSLSLCLALYMSLLSRSLKVAYPLLFFSLPLSLSLSPHLSFSRSLSFSHLFSRSAFLPLSIPFPLFVAYPLLLFMPLSPSPFFLYGKRPV